MWKAAYLTLAQQRLRYLVCVSVCHGLSALILPLRAIRRPKIDTSRFSATLAWFVNQQFSWNHLVHKLWREKERKSQYANDTASPRPVFAALHFVNASEVTQRTICESKAIFNRYPRIRLSSRSEKRLVFVYYISTRMCLHRSRMRVLLRDPPHAQYYTYTDNVVYMCTCKFISMLHSRTRKLSL